MMYSFRAMILAAFCCGSALGTIALSREPSVSARYAQAPTGAVFSVNRRFSVDLLGGPMGDATVSVYREGMGGKKALWKQTIDDKKAQSLTGSRLWRWTDLHKGDRFQSHGGGA